jgi:hypothetical protein
MYYKIYHYYYIGSFTLAIYKKLDSLFTNRVSKWNLKQSSKSSPVLQKKMSESILRVQVQTGPSLALTAVAAPLLSAVRMCIKFCFK